MEKFYVQEDGFAKEAYDDFKGTMEKLAKMGYSGIEIYYGLHGGLKPTEMKDFMDSIGMEVIGSHVDLDKTDENLKYLPGTGCKYIICPGFMHLETLDEVYKAAETLNENGRKAKEVGMKYGYHNHAGDFSYIDGKMINDVLIENTDPDLVAFEIDVAWAWRGGVNAHPCPNARSRRSGGSGAGGYHRRLPESAAGSRKRGKGDRTDPARRVGHGKRQGGDLVLRYI